MIRTTWAVAISMVLFSVVPVRAVDREGVVSLTQLKLWTLEESTLVHEIRFEQAEEVAEAEDEARLEDPTLHSSIAFPAGSHGNNSKNELEVALTQILRMGDFGQRRKLSQSQISFSSAEARDRIRQVLYEVSLRYGRLWTLQVEHKHLREQLKRSRDVLERVQRFSADGIIDPKDALLAEMQAGRLEAALVGNESATKLVVAELMKMTGKELNGLKAEKPVLEQLPSFAQLRDLAKVSEDSRFQRLALLRTLADQTRRLAQTESIPAVQPGLFYSRNDEGEDYVGLGLSVSLPFFKGRSYEKKIANAREESTQALAGYVETGVYDQELEHTYRAALSHVKQREIFHKKVRLKAEKMVLTAHQQFQIGQLSLIDLWQIEREYHDILDEELNLELAAFRGYLDLKLLAGLDL